LIEAKQPTAARDDQVQEHANLKGAFFWLSAFYVIYCARPEDWIPGLSYIPVAKISGLLALAGLLSSIGSSRRKFRDLPQESSYLLAMVGVLFISAFLSPIWRGGAVNKVLDFAKVYVIWALTFLVITDFGRLRRIVYIQAASVAAISAVSVAKGHSQPRLEGVIGGLYSNPNDLAFAIVLTLPFCLAFLLSAKNVGLKLLWIAAILIMGLTLFMTASRAGLITLLISGTVCLWHFGVKGRRFYLVVVSGLAAVLLLAVAGGPLMRRTAAIIGQANNTFEETAYDSYEARKELMTRAIEGIERYPILGLGAGNFIVYSGTWHDVHMTYLQIAADGGIPALILYLLFFGRGFSNVKKLLRRRDLDVRTSLFVGALHSSMIGFVIGALFAPEAYQFFPYFTVAYTSALLAMTRERAPDSPQLGKDWRSQYGNVRATRSHDLTHVQ